MLGLSPSCVITIAHRTVLFDVTNDVAAISHLNPTIVHGNVTVFNTVITELVVDVWFTEMRSLSIGLAALA